MFKNNWFMAAKIFFENNKKEWIISGIILLLFLNGILISSVMSAFVVMLFMFIFIFILFCFFVKKNNYKFKTIMIKLIIIVLSLIITNNILSYFSIINLKESVSNDVLAVAEEVSSTISGDSDESFGTGRFYIWRETFKYLSDYIWTGIGIDNFAYLGYEDGTYIYDSDYRIHIIYKAHNEFLQILSTEGIFTLIVYLIILFMIFIINVKKLLNSNKLDIFRLSLLVAFCGYLVQAFFNIRITFIAPIFFMICGLLVSGEEKEY